MARSLPALPVGVGLACALLLWPVVSFAWEMAGTKQIALHTRDGTSIPIGTVTFKPQGVDTGFAVDLNLKEFHDFFLSMREFKCLEGPELQCYVAYPYANPKIVRGNDLSWLEHSLIFFFKTPADYSAKLSNGLYYAMKITDDGIVGTPQAIDLNDIASPPRDPSTPPFGPDTRTEVPTGSRWVDSLVIW